MKKTSGLRLAVRLMISVLIVALALSVVGCNGTTQKQAQTSALQDTGTDPVSGAPDLGKNFFTLVVTDLDGNESTTAIQTNETTVGEALLKAGIIQGEDGPYGLFVKTVNGITLDFDKDGKYWAFYVDGAYATSGAEKTPIEQGKVYAFKPEK